MLTGFHSDRRGDTSNLDLGPGNGPRGRWGFAIRHDDDHAILAPGLWKA